MFIRSYTELSTILTFEDRFEYLKLNGNVGTETFGYDRYINQKFYTSKEWRDIRRFIITRDFGRDLGVVGFEIPELMFGNRKYSDIVIHHMNPINIDDVVDVSEHLLNPEYLVCTSNSTHRAIHYGISKHKQTDLLVERFKNDTCPWKR